MSDNYISEIRLFPWNWAPKYWALCNGALLPIAQNQALFSLLGTTYGGDGIRTFALPDLRGRVAIHFNTTYPLGALSGQETAALTSSQIPQHVHMVLGASTGGDQPLPTNYVLADNSEGNNYYTSAKSLTTLNPTSMSAAGQGLPHDNMQPYLVLNYCICTQGVFPSRN